jgi:hypothetical protein
MELHDGKVTDEFLLVDSAEKNAASIRINGVLGKAPESQ